MIDKELEEQFLLELDNLTKKYGIKIESSEFLFLEEIDETEFGEDFGYYYSNQDSLYWGIKQPPYKPLDTSIKSGECFGNIGLNNDY